MIKIPGSVIILAVYAILNGMVMFLYACDKTVARKNTWRTPESQLLFFALVGPFGAYAAMQVFRHKTRKLKFYLVPVFAILHIAILIWVLMYFMN
ncbi:MAG TPA: DUF1294 domain-containing protein [Methanoregula sp.]|nr:DUF1294 domain-containing protein [Methanoregula sp.]